MGTYMKNFYPIYIQLISRKNVILCFGADKILSAQQSILPPSLGRDLSPNPAPPPT